MRKNKYIIGTNFATIISVIFMLLFIISAICAIPIMFTYTKMHFITIILLYVFCLPLSFYLLFAAAFANFIILKKEEMCAKSDLLYRKSEKIQYKTIVKYKDIEKVSIMSMSKNSKGKYADQIVTPIPYLCVYTRENKKIKRFSINSMSKRNVKTLLNELQIRCVQAGNPIFINVDKLMNDFKKTKRAIEDDKEDNNDSNVE